MASNEDPEEARVSCPVCFIPFRQPKSLRCGHLLCTPCAQVMLDQNQDGTIQCAICRRVSEERDLRRDFTMEENVLQFLKKQQVKDMGSKKKIEKEPLREVCQNCCLKSPTLSCSECKLILCLSCGSHHKAMKHKVINIDENTRHVKRTVDRIIQNYKSKFNSFDKKLKALQKSRVDVDVKTNGVVLEIQKFAELVAKKCQQLEEYAIEEKAAEIKKIDVIEEHVASTLQDIQAHTDFLQSILIENNTSTLLKPGLIEDLQSTFDRNIRCYDHAENEVIPAEFNIHFNKPPKIEQRIEKLNVQTGANDNKNIADEESDGASSSNATFQQVMELLQGWGPPPPPPQPQAPAHHQLQWNNQPTGYWGPSHRPPHPWGAPRMGQHYRNRHGPRQ